MNIDFIQALDDIIQDKGISKEVMMDALKTALLSAYKKDFGSKENVRVDIDGDSGEVQVYQQKKVVEEVENEIFEVSLEEARQQAENYEPGDIIEIEVTPENFGRIAAQTAKQVVMQRIREAERDVIYEEYKQKEKEIITGTIQRFHKSNVLIDLGKTEALLPASEQIPGEEYRKGDRIKVYIVEVSSTTKGPKILVSRTHPGLLKRLFELEVPEIYEGVVTIEAVAREAGHRSKMAVSSTNKDVDPVGSCVGPQGMRVKEIVEELNGEKIDIIAWQDNPAELISNAVNPAEVIQVNLEEEDREAEVVVPDFQLSLAIGKQGQNARLAAKLTGWKIDIVKESDYEERMSETQEDGSEQLSETPEIAEESGSKADDGGQNESVQEQETDETGPENTAEKAKKENLESEKSKEESPEKVKEE